jgi:hypothetical protein
MYSQGPGPIPDPGSTPPHKMPSIGCQDPLQRLHKIGRPLLRPARLPALTAFLIVLLGALAALGLEVGHSQEPATSLAIDADPTDNSETSLGPQDSCISVSQGDTFEVDVTITDVTDLLAWEASFTYDPEVVQVADRDVELFQAADGESTIFDVSQSTPDSDGMYGLGAVDTADPEAPDSGSGVLARLTLEAVGPGASPLALPEIDLNDDTVLDRGPVLRNVAGEGIGDEDDDGLFDDPVSDAQVVVDGPCPKGGADEDDGFPWLILGIVLAAAAIVAVAGGGLIAYRASRRGRASAA